MNWEAVKMDGLTSHQTVGFAPLGPSQRLELIATRLPKRDCCLGTRVIEHSMAVWQGNADRATCKTWQVFASEIGESLLDVHSWEVFQQVSEGGLAFCPGTCPLHVHSCLLFVETFSFAWLPHSGYPQPS